MLDFENWYNMFRRIYIGIPKQREASILGAVGACTKFLSCCHLFVEGPTRNAQYNSDCVLCSDLRKVHIPYRTKLFIGINVHESRDCQNCEKYEPISCRCLMPENNTEE